jgi:GDP-4-dehydro-6-deoxy-D-mannose reductase
MSKKYLILGAGSQIAKYFIDEFEAQENLVYKFFSNPGDNCGLEIFNNLINESNPDIIINFIGSRYTDFNESYFANVLIPKNLLDAALGLDFKGRIVLIGTAAEYGIQKDYSEDCHEKPKNIYGLTKLMQKNLFIYYTDNYHLEAIYIRPFNILYENIQDNNLFIGSFNKQLLEALKNKTYEIELGNLDVYRDYLLIDDFYEGFMTIIDRGKSGEIYNLGMGESLYLKKFVEDIMNYLNVPIIISKKDISSAGGININVCANIEKIKRLGWKPKIQVDDISTEYFKRIKKLIQDFI